MSFINDAYLVHNLSFQLVFAVAWSETIRFLFLFCGILYVDGTLINS